ncbi:TcpD family membrane protein [Streptomyces sp. PU-14G]|uniref:TcpD family membrane protein n=1 Tax=Streptomyces sp. PU-14G TaxID=2800808 RepID=UPI0034E01F0B
MVSNVVQLASTGAQINIAAADDITGTAQTIGQAILAATVIFAVVAAFFTEKQRRWMVVGTIVLIGGFTFMIVGNPTGTLETVGGFIERNVWNPILSE